MYDIGQVVHLEATPTDAAGNPADVTTMVLTVSRPDGTSATPTVTHGTVGIYTADFTPTQAGRHLFTWAGTGGTGAAYRSTEIANVWPTDPRFLISLADARSSIRSGGFTGNDEDLRLYIAAVTPVLEDIVGPLVVESKTETFDGGGTVILLAGYGVTVTSLAVNGSTGVEGTDYTVEPDTGMVYAAGGSSTLGAASCGWWSGSSYRFARGVRNVSVTYTAGAAQIPPNIILAAKEEFRFLWQNGMQGNRPGWDGNADDLGYTPSGFAVPRYVIQLCAGRQRPRRYA